MVYAIQNKVEFKDTGKKVFNFIVLTTQARCTIKSEPTVPNTYMRYYWWSVSTKLCL